MADGDVLKIVAGHQAFAAPSGGVQQVSLIGPYRANWDTAGQGGTLYGQGGTITVGDDLPIGSVVFAIWPIPVTTFVTGDTLPVVCVLGVGWNNVPDDNMIVLSSGWQVRLLAGLSGKFTAVNYIPNAVDTGAFGMTTVDASGVKIASYLQRSGGDASAGALDIYALIATPV